MHDSTRTAPLCLALLLGGCTIINIPNIKEPSHQEVITNTRDAKFFDIFEEVQPEGSVRYWICLHENHLIEIGTIIQASPNVKTKRPVYPITKKIPKGSPEWDRLANTFDLLP